MCDFVIYQKSNDNSNNIIIMSLLSEDYILNKIILI